MSFAVRMVDISKSFGKVQALDSVTLEVETGTMHAVVGENGAGKTTLMRALYGAMNPDSGTIEVEGRLRDFRSSADAVAAGVGMVSQHYGIIPALTCLQNLILGSEGGVLLKSTDQQSRAEQLAREMGFQFDWKAEASTLSPASTQKLEILKLLWRDSRIMILDEPTAMLGPSDADALFESLGSLVGKGATVILVTHRLPEVMNHCAAVTVLRGGKLVENKVVSETNASHLARLIIGAETRELGDLGLSHEADVGQKKVAANRSSGPLTLRLNGVTVKDFRGRDALQNVKLEVEPGELIGVAGVDGNGQQELLQAILGTLTLTAGSIQFLGKEQATLSPGERLHSGLRLIPEDRHTEAVIESWPVEENAALGLHTLEPLAHGGRVDARARRVFAERVAARFRTKHGGLGLPMASLSGGNQQRIVAARALELGPKLLVAFQPARGLDLGATGDVYKAIREECARGMAALVISFDLDELLAHCDRIVVLNNGKLLLPSESEGRSREAIGRLMVGAT